MGNWPTSTSGADQMAATMGNRYCFLKRSENRNRRKKLTEGNAFQQVFLQSAPYQPVEQQNFSQHGPVTGGEEVAALGEKAVEVTGGILESALLVEIAKRHGRFCG